MGIRAAVRRRLTEATGKDSGFTMIEIVVVMVIMSVVLVIFTTGISQAFSAENKVDTAANADAQVLSAFQRLDKQVRYATGVSLPGTYTGDPVVEWLTNFSGTPTCYQLRLRVSTGQLQQRTWQDGLPTKTPTGWQQLASNVKATTPFVRSQPDPTYQYQRLQVVMAVTLGVNKNATTKQSNVTFTALNTTSASASAADPCQGVRGVQW